MERHSALDGTPLKLPALMKAQKIFKKALKADLVEKNEIPENSTTFEQLGEQLFPNSCSCRTERLGCRNCFKKSCS